MDKVKQVNGYPVSELQERPVWEYEGQNPNLFKNHYAKASFDFHYEKLQAYVKYQKIRG